MDTLQNDLLNTNYIGLINYNKLTNKFVFTTPNVQILENFNNDYQIRITIQILFLSAIQMLDCVFQIVKEI